MKKLVKKIILIIFLIWILLLLIFHVFVPALNNLENKSIANFWGKSNKLEYSMSKQDVLKILGKPKSEFWIETKNSELSNKITAKYKKLYVLEYHIGIRKKKKCRMFFDEKMNFIEKQFIPWFPFDIY